MKVHAVIRAVGYQKKNIFENPKNSFLLAEMRRSEFHFIASRLLYHV